MKNRVDYYLLHTYVRANMGIRSAYQHEISLPQKIITKKCYFKAELILNSFKLVHIGQALGDFLSTYSSLVMTRNI